MYCLWHDENFMIRRGDNLVEAGEIAEINKNFGYISVGVTVHL